jgi:hypothetical protein
MPSKKHKPEEIIGKLREAEIVLAQGASTAEACRRIAVSEQTYYRWRKEYGGLKTDQARRMKDLEKENQATPGDFGSDVGQADLAGSCQGNFSRGGGAASISCDKICRSECPSDGYAGC